MKYMLLIAENVFFLWRLVLASFSIFWKLAIGINIGKR